MISCTSVSFDQPQPIDAKNCKKIPKKFRGTWVSNDDTTIIGKTFFRKIDWNFETLSKAELDTNKSLVIRGKFIYDLEDDSLKGYEYTVMDDSLIVKIPDRFEFTLGNSAQLRSVSKKYLTLNLKQDSIWWNVYLVEKKNDGRIVIRSSKQQDLSILESILNTNEIEITSPDKDELETSEFQKFWSVELSSKQIIEFINEGGFSDTALVLEPIHKIEK